MTTPIKTRYAASEVDESILTRISEQEIFDWLVARLNKEMSIHNVRSIELQAREWRTQPLAEGVDFTVDVCVFSTAKNLTFGETSIGAAIAEVIEKDAQATAQQVAEGAEGVAESHDGVRLVIALPEGQTTPKATIEHIPAQEVQQHVAQIGGYTGESTETVTMPPHDQALPMSIIDSMPVPDLSPNTNPSATGPLKLSHSNDCPF